MVFDAKPANIERLRVVVVVGMRLCSAHLTRHLLDLAVPYCVAKDDVSRSLVGVAPLPALYAICVDLLSRPRNVSLMPSGSPFLFPRIPRGISSLEAIAARCRQSVFACSPFLKFLPGLLAPACRTRFHCRLPPKVGGWLPIRESLSMGYIRTVYLRPGTDRSRASAQAGHCASDPACRPSPRSALGARRLPAFRPAKSVPARRA